MAEEMAIAIAEAADLVLNGYAVTRSEGNFRVVNLKTGKAAYVMASGELSETNMDDVEAGIVTCLVAEKGVNQMKNMLTKTLKSLAVAGRAMG